MSGENGIKLWDRGFPGRGGENLDFGYRLYSSITFSRYSPVGNDPTRSTATLIHVFSLSGDGSRGSGGGNVSWVEA